MDTGSSFSAAAHRIRVAAAADLGLIEHLNGTGWLRMLFSMGLLSFLYEVEHRPQGVVGLRYHRNHRGPILYDFLHIEDGEGRRNGCKHNSICSLDSGTNSAPNRHDVSPGFTEGVIPPPKPESYVSRVILNCPTIRRNVAFLLEGIWVRV